ncbi:MAG: class A beta-lactamase-related serine hydrolase [Gemmataceae bacterium]|nr:class A beta-lactamase-related serine hydrolase [Gemmataceae bacterium]
MRWALLCPCAGLFLGLLFAQAKPEPLPRCGLKDPGLASFDKLLDSFLKEHKIPGASLAVAKGNQLVYAVGYGYAELPSSANQFQGVGMRPNTLLRIASISKPITAAAILKLVEAKKISLDDKVTSILGFDPLREGNAPLDERWKTITLRQLLEHTGGFDRDKSFDPMFRSIDIASASKKAPPATPPRIIRFMMGKQLDFTPGERYAYSNFGYCLLGRVIEKVTGMSYDAFVKEQILAPLGIADMRIGGSQLGQRAPHEALYYPPGMKKSKSVFPPHEEALVPYGAWYQESLDAHGGWIATAPDLVRFATAMNAGAKPRVLKKESVEQMFAPPLGKREAGPDGKPNPVYYALGWNVRQVAGHDKINTWHTGLLQGTSTLLVRRHDGMTWAILFNGSFEMGPGKKQPASLIDPLLHQAANAVATWADRDLFPPFLTNPNTGSVP